MMGTYLCIRLVVSHLLVVVGGGGDRVVVLVLASMAMLLLLLLLRLFFLVRAFRRKHLSFYKKKKHSVVAVAHYTAEVGTVYYVVLRLMSGGVVLANRTERTATTSDKWCIAQVLGPSWPGLAQPHVNFTGTSGGSFVVEAFPVCSQGKGKKVTRGHESLGEFCQLLLLSEGQRSKVPVLHQQAVIEEVTGQLLGGSGWPLRVACRYALLRNLTHLGAGSELVLLHPWILEQALA